LLHLLSSHGAAASAPPPGHRSFLEGVLLPDLGGLVTDTLSASGAWGLSAGGSVPAGESPRAGGASGAYFDAESVLNSMRQSIPNAVSCSGHPPCIGIQSGCHACGVRVKFWTAPSWTAPMSACLILPNVADLLCVMSAQFFSTTASLHGLGDRGHPAAPAQLRWDLRIAAAGCTLALWYPASAPAAAAAAARAGAGGNRAAGAAGPSSPAAEQQPAGVLADSGQWEQDAADGEGVEAFSQPGDSLMRGGGGESFMSAASQLRGSSASTDSIAAAAACGAASGAAVSAVPAATQPEAAAASQDNEDFGRLELECTDVIIDVSAGGGAGGASAAVRLYALSALEHLPSEDAAYVTAGLLTLADERNWAMLLLPVDLSTGCHKADQPVGSLHEGIHV
jgi:hypothetical protein